MSHTIRQGHNAASFDRQWPISKLGTNKFVLVEDPTNVAHKGE